MSTDPNPSPKSKLQNPKSEIQNPNGAVWGRRKKTKPIQNPNSKIQNPNGPSGVWILDFGFGRAGAGGDGHVANEDVWPCWPPDLGLDRLATERSLVRFPPRVAQIGHRFPAERFCRKSGLDFRPRVAEIGAEFPEKLRARRSCWKRWVNIAQEEKDPSLQNIPIFICKHYKQILFYAIHNPWSNATNLPGRRLTGASLFKYQLQKKGLFDSYTHVQEQFHFVAIDNHHM